MHKDLKDAIARDELVLFVGAGMSMPLGFPSWNELIIEILDDLKEELGETPDRFNFSYYESLGRNLNVFEVLEEMERCNHKQKVKKILYQKINNVDFSLKPLEKHEKLWKISSKIITTNYDKVLEKVKPEDVEAYSNKNIFQQYRSLQGTPFLYKIHGDISDPDTCILFPSDYNELYETKSSNKETLRQFFSGKTILFLGFSLDDPFIKKQLEYIHNLYNGYSNTNFLISKGNKDLSELNINVISIKDWKEHFDEKLEELVALKVANHPKLQVVEKEEESVDISKETDLVKLKNIFDEKKKELEDVNELGIKKAYRELSKVSDRIQELQVKELDFQQLIPNHNQQKLEYIFDEIFNAEKLSPKLKQEIAAIRDQQAEENEWYHRSVLVSALACSIINSDKLDPQKIEFLIDFTNDSEDKIWQKAITYLFLVLNHLGNKWLKHKGVLQLKLKSLQQRVEIQNALNTIIAFIQLNLQGVMPVDGKIFENEYFIDSPFNYFLPFYPDNPSVDKIYEDDSIEDIEDYLTWLYSSPLSDAFKYLICNSEKNNTEEKTEEEKTRSELIIRKVLILHHSFEPYLNYVNDFLNFYKNYPKSLKKVEQEVTVIRINKLKNLLLNTIEQHRVLARQFMLQEDWGKAITQYKALLKIEKEDERALLNLIQCYENTDKNVDDKLRLRLRIKEVLPDDHQNLYEIADLYNIKDNVSNSIKYVKESLKHINEAISLDDKNALYYNGRSVTKNKLKDFKGALLDCDLAIKLDASEAEFYFSRGIIKNKLKDYEEAILDYNKAIDLDDKKADYYNNRASNKYRLKDYKGALSDYNNAISLNDKEGDFYNNRANVKDRLEDYEGAILDYYRAIKLNHKNPDYYLNSASLFRRQGNFTKAHEFCSKATKLGVKDGSDIGTKATIYASEGNDELFYEYIEKAFQAKAKAYWLDDDIKEKYKVEKRFQDLLAKYNQTLEDED